MTDLDKSKLYFYDPRLKMTIFGRMVVRVVGYASYIFLVAATLTLVLLEVDWAFYLGIFMTLFFLDYLGRAGEADRPLYEVSKKGKVNSAKYFRPAAFGILERAWDRSAIKKTSFGLEVLKGLVKLKDIRQGLERMDILPHEFDQRLDDFLKEGLVRLTLEEREGQLEALTQEAFLKAFQGAHKFVEVSDLFSALLVLEDEYIARIFSIFSIDQGDLGRALIFSSVKGQFSKPRSLPSTLGGFVTGAHSRIRHRVMNRAWTSRPTPTLDRYGLDLTDLARHEKAGFLVGHKSEYDRMVDSLARSVNPNVMLVGESGTGKEALVSRLAFNISKDRVPEPLFDKRLVLLQITELTAGASEEELQVRLKLLIEEIVVAGNVILYIPEFHNLVKTSGMAYLSAADAILPVIKNNAFPVIGATYPRELKSSVETRSDILSLFEVIQVQEITSEEAEELLVYESMLLEHETGVVISFGAIKKAVALAKKYFTDKHLPSSADELLRSSLSEVKRRGERVLGIEAVVRVAETRVNVPIHEAREDEAKRLIGLEKEIHERLVDQEEAVKAVANVLREYRSGLSKPGRPMASFLFVGPTGVGKTELARILARIMFGSKEAMVRFDMTEYQDKLSFYRFIGSPDGKVSGALTEAILKKPYALILLDEFEKAYPDILDLFLQVFDDGRLTDNLGRTVDFENTIIIATSNAHSDIINEALQAGQAMAQVAEYLKKKLGDVFKPELLNRFSRVVVFNNLSPDQVREVAALNLRDFGKTLKDQGITLVFDDSVVREIARVGYEPSFGARPLERAVEENLRAPLAEKILKKEVVKGEKYRVVFEGGIFQFIKA